MNYVDQTIRPIEKIELEPIAKSSTNDEYFRTLKITLENGTTLDLNLWGKEQQSLIIRF